MGKVLAGFPSKRKYDKIGANITPGLVDTFLLFSKKNEKDRVPLIFGNIVTILFTACSNI